MNNSYQPLSKAIDQKVAGLSVYGRAAAIFTAVIAIFMAAAGGLVSADSAGSSDSYKAGERLTYTISFNNKDSAAYAEIRVVSKGTLEGRDAIELFGKLRSLDILSAAFYLWDEARTTYVSADNGYPIYIRSVSNTGILPIETVKNHLAAPSTKLDLLSMIYKVRQSKGVGTFEVQEADRTFTLDFTTAGAETVTTEAGQFETGISTVTGPYLTELGIRDFKVNLSSDERALPVLVRLKTAQGEFTARLASVQDLTPEPDISPSAETPKPTPALTPTPEPTPRPYVENLSLSSDLPFELGETLRYRVTKKGAPVADVTVQAKERKLNQGTDSLLLSASADSLGSANDLFGPQDSVLSWVDPETLAPFSYSLKFSAGLASFNQSAVFDQTAGTVSMQGGDVVQVPVGTHNIISLAYAVRAFNLRANPDADSPVNDTRVAIFVGGAPVVLTLRPSNVEQIETFGTKRAAQMITVKAGIPAIDGLNIRFWLSADGRRIPVKLVVGDYQAELMSVKTEPPPAGKPKDPAKPQQN
jgi:hypothetical protein